ncbi:MAG: ribosomal protein S18 acetylase RimI-like enzyme [Halobacteriales archaeon]|jgi:ribosomal protein S18 acetylase RimI-like enzyme
MEIRPLRQDEGAELIDDLWLPFAEEMAEIDPYNELADDARKHAFSYRRERLQDDDVATVVAVASGELAGYVEGEYRDPPPVFAREPEVYVEGVYVRPDYRREGLAENLMDRIEKWAVERECQRVSLDVNVANETAKKLYEDRGYSVKRHRMVREL